MAGNEWIGGYLDAILDTGTVLGEKRKKSDIEGGKEVAAKYFLSELTGSNEFDIQQTWMKATATKNTQARSSRVENFCWRIWHMTRKRKQMQWEEAQRLAHRTMEIEEGRLDMASDIAGETAEETDDDDGPQDTVPSLLSTPGASAAANASFSKSTGDEPERKLYLVLIRYWTVEGSSGLSALSTSDIPHGDWDRSLHGLVRGENMELGRDSDTGGQIKYVVEFARALAALPQVYRVDLLTRQILSKEVDWSYGEPTEMLSTLDDGGGGESGGAYIVRIPCGPREEYVRKELLWPYVPEFVDGALSHIVHMARVLGEQVGGGDPVWPHVVHGHYADAGDIAGLLSGALGVPMVLTGHSLGRNKLEQLLKQGRQSPEDINNTYKIMRRIEAEEFALDSAELVITSTRQEIDQQWGLYDGFDVRLERILRARQQKGVDSHGRYMPRMVVVPPGMDFSNVVKESEEVEGAETGSEPAIWSQVMRFFTNPRKPIILALARPDPKKNLVTLLKTFGECAPLRELANLVLIMGNRDSIDDMSSGNAEILTTVLKLIDRYDLYGQVSYPKHHKQFEVPEIYRLAAKSKGVFVNPALVEPFGLTLIEAAAHGLPMVATKNGGPVDIQKALDNGELVDPHDQDGIAAALLRMVADRPTWNKYHENGLKNIHCYSWPEHCRKYLVRVSQCRMRHPQWRGDAMMDFTDTDSQGDSLRDARDLSLRLSMDGKSMNSPADLARILGEFEAASQLPSRRAAGNRSTGLQSMREEEGEEEGEVHTIMGGVAVTSGTNLSNRRGLVVVALDYYEEGGEAGKSMGAALKSAFEAIESAQLQGLGVALATALSGAEAATLLIESGLGLGCLDVVIAGSGSEVYYVVKTTGEGKGPLADREGRHLVADLDYVNHMDYRWGGDGLRRSMLRVIAATREGGDTPQPLGLAEDSQKCTAFCLTYKVMDPDQAPSTMELRKRLRMRGLRCHVVYCRNATALHLVPLHASRAQALRYLFVRWGLDVSKMVVLVGPMGDGDHVEMLSGTHKTLLLAEPVPSCSQTRRKLMTTTEDGSSAEAPNVQNVKSMQGVGEALKALKFE